MRHDTGRSSILPSRLRDACTYALVGLSVAGLIQSVVWLVTPDRIAGIVDHVMATGVAVGVACVVPGLMLSGALDSWRSQVKVLWYWGLLLLVVIAASVLAIFVPRSPDELLVSLAVVGLWTQRTAPFVFAASAAGSAWLLARGESNGRRISRTWMRVVWVFCATTIATALAVMCLGRPAVDSQAVLASWALVLTGAAATAIGEPDRSERSQTP
jgi:hypothetical protein